MLVIDKVKIPEHNVAVYSYIYSIENTLRELMIESFSVMEGARWYKKRLPKDILEKYQNGIQFERSLKWYRLVPHHPIYYIDFADLRKIIEREDNWRDVFKGIFRRKDFISSTFSELEYVRNKIAHNRKVMSKDVENVKIIHNKIIGCVGEDYYNKLSGKHTYLMDIPKQMKMLAEECEITFCKCTNCEYLQDLEIWPLIQNQWWFDESYLCHALDGITDYFKTMEEYCSLERFRGSGHKIESWVESVNIKDKYRRAQIEFSDILDI